MGLEKYLKEVDGLSDNEKQSMIELTRELQAGGMSEKEADQAVLLEMRDDIDNDMRSLKEQLGVKVESEEETKGRHGKTRKGEIDEMHADYRKEIFGIDSGKGKKDNSKKD